MAELGRRPGPGSGQRDGGQSSHIWAWCERGKVIRITAHNEGQTWKMAETPAQLLCEGEDYTKLCIPTDLVTEPVRAYFMVQSMFWRPHGIRLKPGSAYLSSFSLT